MIERVTRIDGRAERSVTPNVIEQWCADPVAFIEHTLYDPESGRPFKLLDAEREFLKHAFKIGNDGRLLYPEQLYACPKKSGKTAFAALHTLTTILLFGGRFAEGYALANDLDQAQSRVFQAIRRIVEASPLLKREAKITNDTISFPHFDNATISAIASDYTGAAGANPTISCFDELWGYVSERSRRLWDEMSVPPTRKIACRLTVTYAGFEGESTLLQELYNRGLKQPVVGTDLHAGDGLLMFWSHQPVAPWQSDAWIADMRRSLRPNQFLRMVENRWVNTESSFIDMAQWDRCVDPNLTPCLVDRGLAVWIGVDASTKHDTTALAAVAFDKVSQRVRLINHKIFQPSPEQPLDFEASVEKTLHEWADRYRIKAVLYDPFQMVATAQRLSRDGLPMVECNQTSSTLTEAGSNLYELIQGGNLVTYPAEDIRLCMARAVATESSRGWKIDKAKQSHKIDVVVALAMAARAAVQAHTRKPGRYLVTSYSQYADGVEHPLYEVGRDGQLIELDKRTGRPLEAYNPLSPGPHNECKPGKSINSQPWLDAAATQFNERMGIRRPK